AREAAVEGAHDSLDLLGGERTGRSSAEVEPADLDPTRKRDGDGADLRDECFDVALDRRAVVVRERNRLVITVAALRLAERHVDVEPDRPARAREARRDRGVIGANAVR